MEQKVKVVQQHAEHPIFTQWPGDVSAVDETECEG